MLRNKLIIIEIQGCIYPPPSPLPLESGRFINIVHYYNYDDFGKVAKTKQRLAETKRRIE